MSCRLPLSVLMGKATGKDRHQLYDIGRQLCFKTLPGRRFEYDNFNAEVLAKLEDKISSKAEEAILMIDNEVTELSLKDQPQKFF
jgi:hypothetical protein